MGACCIETFGNGFGRCISFDHAIRTNFARPSSFIRLRDLTAIDLAAAMLVSLDFKERAGLTNLDSSIRGFSA